MANSLPLSYNAPRGPCFVCGVESLPCARCRVHYYCGKEHQRQHWPAHRHGCGSVEARDGRLVATKDIPAETVILRELPRVTFLDLNNTNPVRSCLACYVPLPGKEACQRCGVPMCSVKCSQDDRHEAECKAFQRANFKIAPADTRGDMFIYMLAAVRALRTALLAKRDARFSKLPSAIRLDGEGTPIAKAMSVNAAELRRDAVKWLRETVGISCVSEEELLRAAALNHLHGETVYDRNMVGCWGICVGSALLGLSCLPNVALIPLDDMPGVREYVAVTTRKVAAGEALTCLRGKWTDETRVRREPLLPDRGSACRCERCVDPTELGMYVGSPCCPDCAKSGKQAYVVALGDDFESWKCEGCDRTFFESEVDKLTQPAKSQLKRLVNQGAGPREFLKFIEMQVHPKGPLHDTHTLVLSALESVRFIIFTTPTKGIVTRENVHEWLDVCRRLERAVDRLLPGVSEQRLLIFMALRRLLLFRYPKNQERMNQYFETRGVELYGHKTTKIDGHTWTYAVFIRKGGTYAVLSAKSGAPNSFTGDLEALKQEIGAVTQEVLRHMFTHEEAELKFSLKNFPFVQI